MSEQTGGRPKQIAAVVITLIGALLALAPARAAAQEIGAEGGINLASFVINYDETPGATVEGKWMTGLVVGGYVSVFRMDAMTVQVEGLYSVKGGKFAAPVDGRFEIAYLEVPVTAWFRMGSFRLFGGATVAAKLSAKFKSDDTSIDVEEFEGSDYGVTGGLGFESGRLRITGRYTYGLKNIIKDNPDEVSNQAFTIMAGWRIK